MVSLFLLINAILGLFKWAIIIVAILSLLIHFNVVNTRNQLVFTIYDFLRRVTEPVLARVRRVVPPVQGVDLSAIIVILLIFFLQSLLVEYGLLSM